MAEVSYDDIFLNLTSKLNTKGLEDAVTALKGLQSVTGFSGLKQASNDLNDFMSALDGITNKRARTITNLAKAIKGLGGARKSLKAVADATAQSNPLNDTSVGTASAPNVNPDAMKQIKKEAEKASEATKDLKDNIEKAQSPLERLSKKFKNFMEYRAMRAVWNAFINGAKEGLKNLENWDRNIGMTGFSDAMDRARASLTMLKNSLAVIVAPGLEYLIGVLQKVASWAIVAANAISRFFAIIGGKSTYRAVKAIDSIASSEASAGGSAKKATAEFKKQLMAFDEINNITEQNNGGSGGGGGAGVGGGLSDMFEELDVGDLTSLEQWFSNAGEAWRKGVADLKERFAESWDKLKENWGTFKETWATTYEENTRSYADAEKKWEALTQRFKDYFTSVWAETVREFKSAGEKIKSAWGSVKEYFSSVWAETVREFQTAKDKINATFSPVFEGLKNGMSAFVLHVKAGIEKIKAYIEYGATLASSLWDVLSGKKSLAEFKANMEEAKNVLEGKVKKATDDLRNALENTFNRKWYVKTVWDEIINRTVHVNEIYTAIGSNGMRTVEKYAEGGIVPQGQLFIAREAGAEMVGQIGGHTAVANNQDIVASVSQGVANAVASVLGNGRSNVTVTLEGDAKGLFKVVQKEGRAYSARTGQPALA